MPLQGLIVKLIIISLKVQECVLGRSWLAGMIALESSDSRGADSTEGNLKGVGVD